MAVSEKGMAY